MAGRAGRRGIDEEGFAFMVVDLNYFDPSQFPSMKEDEVEPLQSQFSLTYNSILNLVKNYSEEEILPHPGPELRHLPGFSGAPGSLG